MRRTIKTFGLRGPGGILRVGVEVEREIPFAYLRPASYEKSVPILITYDDGICPPRKKPRKRKEAT